MDEVTLASDDRGTVTIRPVTGDRHRFEFSGEDGRSFSLELGPIGAVLLSDLDRNDLLDFMELSAEGDPGAGGVTTVEMTDLDRSLVALAAEEAQAESGGPLDPAAVWRFSQERRMSMSEAWSTLSAALEGSYEGNPANLRGGPTIEAAWRRAERAGVSVGKAIADLAAGGESGRDDHLIADLADRYAQEHGVGYAEALIRVQLRRREEG